MEFTAEEAAKLTPRIQNAGTEVVEAKAGAGSATLSMAYAAARMAESVLLGLSGEKVRPRGRRGGCVRAGSVGGWYRAVEGRPHAVWLLRPSGCPVLVLTQAARRLLPQGIVECTYVESEVVPGFQYFASKVGAASAACVRLL